MAQRTWNPDFVRSFKDFFAFAEWDAGRRSENELKAVWAEYVPVKEVETPTLPTLPTVEEKTVNPENDHNAE